MKRSPIKLVLAVFFICALVPGMRAEPVSSEVARSLPDQIGNYRALGPVQEGQENEDLQLELQSATRASRTYSAGESRVLITIYVTGSDSKAYSALTLRSAVQNIKFGEVGTASVLSANGLEFFKGRNYVTLRAESGKPELEHFVSLARGVAQKVDPGDKDIPVLVKHLPNWETARVGAKYVTSLRSLKKLFAHEPVLDVISFEAGVEAVAATYHGPERSVGELVIIEFTTPQHASENDRFINAKLNELRSADSLHVPTAYRRVGNYAVFVFNGADTQAAAKLIDEVKYEQVTQWLGNNPYPLLEAQQKYVNDTLGVLMSVVKSTGIAVVACMSFGAIFGGLLFLRRRSQQRAETYSDAGGMVRLNLDELTGETNAARLIGRSR